MKNDNKTVLAVPDDIVPCRIDIYLVQEGIGLSRNQIQKLIRNSSIRVVDKGTKPNFILRGGETIEIEIPVDEPFKLLPEDIPIDIIYEDEHLLVLDKPTGMVTHPARGNWTGTLINAALFHTQKLSPIGGDFRPGVVHRLDKNTSGLIIIAKRAEVHLKLAAMFAEREIHRQYIAIIWGHLDDNHVVVEGSIGNHPKDHRRRAVITHGKSAKTEFTVIAGFDFLQLIRAKLHTGRTHQIRVHLDHIGHPVFGDPEYGGRGQRINGISPQHRKKAKELLKLTSSQLLHAKELYFKHPATSEMMEFDSPIPEDFAKTLNALGFPGG